MGLSEHQKRRLRDDSDWARCPTRHDRRMHERIGVSSVETRSSWVVATVLLVILALSFGAPWITIVALKLIAAESDGLRAVPALATSLAWLGFGSGGIAMGYVADRVGGR